MIQFIFSIAILAQLTKAYTQKSGLRQVEVKYSEAFILKNTSNFRMVAFAPDYSLCILYNTENTTSYSQAYTPYNWQPLQDTQQQYILKYPTYVQFYQNPDALKIGAKSNNIIYSTIDGDIISKIFYPSHTQKILYSVALKKASTISKIAVSSDGTLWAAYASYDNKIYIGNVSETTQNVRKITEEDNSYINDIVWRPSTHQLILTGNSQQGSYLRIYNYSDNKTYNILVPQDQIYSLEFSYSGDLFILQATQDAQQRIVRVYNLQSNIYRKFKVPSQSYGLTLRGNIIQFKEYSQYIYKVNYNNMSFDYDQRFFYASGNSGLGPQGIYYITRSYGIQYNFTIYKLCNKEGYYYDSQFDQCKTCEQPCKQCILKPTTCTSCLSEREYIDPFLMACLPCSPHCESCINDNRCLKCQQNYINNGTCHLCFELIRGCSICEGNDTCLKCSEGYLPNDKVCQSCSSKIKGCQICQSDQKCIICQDGFILNGSTCSICSKFIEGCLTCKNTSYCSECLGGYVPNKNKTCSRCSSVFQGCLYCQSDSACSECQIGFAHIQSICKPCYSLMKGCQRCQSQSQCTKCYEDYQVDPDSKQCVQSSFNLPWIYYAIIVILVLVIVIIIISAIIVIKKRKVKQQLRRSSTNGLLHSTTTLPTSTFVRQKQRYERQGFLIPQ